MPSGSPPDHQPRPTPRATRSAWWRRPSCFITRDKGEHRLRLARRRLISISTDALGRAAQTPVSPPARQRAVGGDRAAGKCARKNGAGRQRGQGRQGAVAKMGHQPNSTASALEGEEPQAKRSSDWFEGKVARHASQRWRSPCKSANQPRRPLVDVAKVVCSCSLSNLKPTLGAPSALQPNLAL